MNQSQALESTDGSRCHLSAYVLFHELKQKTSERIEVNVISKVMIQSELSRQHRNGLEHGYMHDKVRPQPPIAPGTELHSHRREEAVSAAHDEPNGC